MKLVLQHPTCKMSIVIEQRTNYSKYILSYFGNVLYNEETGSVYKKDGVVGKFDTIEELLYFIEFEDRQYPWFIDKVKQEFNI